MGIGGRRRRWGGSSRTVASDGDARGEKRAFVSLIFYRDSDRDGLEALEPCGWFEVGALFTTVKFRVALGAIAGEIGSRR